MSTTTDKPTRSPDDILKAIREGARRGGLARSAKKTRAARKNIKLANAARGVAS